MKKIIFICVISILLINIISSCKKEDLVIINAGNDIGNADNFFVTLNAQSLSSGESGEWVIKTGLTDEKVFFEDKTSPVTKFHGLPGQKYVLVWKVLHNGKYYEDSINVTFKPIIVRISAEGSDKYSTRISLTADNTYGGKWTTTGGNLERVEYVSGPFIKIYGKENNFISAKWTVTYGSVSFSDSITYITHSYNEYEALEDLGLTSENPGGSYILENGHVVEINLGADGRGWTFTQFSYYPALRSLKYLRRLNLFGDGITIFPEEITSYYKDLTYLNLAGNYINQLPDDIGNLSNMETLILNNQQGSNQITSLPESFCNLVNLKFLELSSNNISQLPSDFGNLTKLESLYLWNSLLDSLPTSFGNLVALKYFYGAVNANLPESFSKLINLVELNIGGGPDVTKLPDNIGNLKKLKIFAYQGDMKIEKLPDSICELDSLNELVFRSNLKELPANIGNLKSLQKLDLYSNIAGLPASIIYLTNLKFLILRSSNETGPVFQLPENIGLMTNLEGIKIQNTNLYSLPESIGSLSKLTDIYIENCKLQSVPSGIGDLRNLSDLFLDNNELSVIPDNFKNLSLGNRIYRISLAGNANLAWQIDAIRSWNICTELIF